MIHTHLPLCTRHKWMSVLTSILKTAMVLGAVYSQEVSSYYNIMHVQKKKIFKQFIHCEQKILYPQTFLGIPFLV